MCIWSLPGTQQAFSNFATAAGSLLLLIQVQIASEFEEDKQLNICRSESLTPIPTLHLMLPVRSMQA